MYLFIIFFSILQNCLFFAFTYLCVGPQDFPSLIFMNFIYQEYYLYDAHGFHKFMCSDLYFLRHALTMIYLENTYLKTKQIIIYRDLLNCSYIHTLVHLEFPWSVLSGRSRVPSNLPIFLKSLVNNKINPSFLN